MLNHREPGYLDRLKELTGGRGPDVILEHLANVNLDNDLTALAFGGRVVVVGNRGRIEIDPRKTMGKDAAIVGMALWNTTPRGLRRGPTGRSKPGWRPARCTPLVVAGAAAGGRGSGARAGPAAGREGKDRADSVISVGFEA